MFIAYIHDSQLMWAQGLAFFCIFVGLVLVAYLAGRGFDRLENAYYELKRKRAAEGESIAHDIVLAYAALTVVGMVVMAIWLVL